MRGGEWKFGKKNSGKGTIDDRFCLRNVSGKEAKESQGDGDWAVVRRVREGENQAFEILVLKYQERIFRLIRRLLGSREHVEDLAQEVFIRAYRSLGSFKGESSFYTWLYKIAVNTCRNHYRSLGRRPEGSVVNTADLIDTMEAGSESPERGAFRAEFWDAVRSSLKELPLEQREAVVLCDLEGLSYEQMATVMDVPVGTVRSRVFRGRRLLQGLLTPYLPAGPSGQREKKP